MAKKETKCLNPKCKRVARSRGLCASCYVLAFNLVKTGRTTWDDLVESGKALPSSRSKGATAWLLGSKHR